MALMHAADHAGRPISLDGDNRLISGEHTEIASLHYNIDGTISQWDHSTPLTIGGARRPLVSMPSERFDV